VKEEMEMFYYILGKWKHSPSLITLCRSQRDGYVPRQWQGVIEATILDIMEKLKFISNPSRDISYDNDLWHSAEESL
jgi:hypothetical protein